MALPNCLPIVYMIIHGGNQKKDLKTQNYFKDL